MLFKLKITAIIFTIVVFISSCSSGESSAYPMDKPYWNPDDYESVILEIKFNIPEGEMKPSYAHPELRPVFERLVNRNNFEVILGDDELGLSYRKDVSDSFFDNMRDMIDLYTETNREDKFIYGNELIDVEQWGLAFQLHHFELGNDLILFNADDPESDRVQRVIRSNENTVVSNFNLYLDLVNKETFFEEDALYNYCKGIEVYFSSLMEKYPDANYSGMLRKAKLMKDKSTTQCIVQSLTDLINKIESLQKAKEMEALEEEVS